MAVTYTTLSVAHASNPMFTVRGYSGGIVGLPAPPAGSSSSITITDLGNGIASVTVTGSDSITDLGNGLASIAGATVTDLGNGLATAA